MISIQKEEINSIPSLTVTYTNKINEPLPLIIYFHGFTSAKEHNLPIAYLLADKGYRVILPDSKYHGERETVLTASERQISFWNIVIQNIDDLQKIKDYYEQRKLILNNRIGIAGTSMGGITTSAALTQYSWINVAAVLMGSPKIMTFAKALVNHFKQVGDLPLTEEMVNNLYASLEKYDLSKQPDKLDHRPLLFWHGENDAVVPFDHSFTFYNEVKNLYKNMDQIRLIKEKNRGHKISRYAILETVKWFEKFL